MIPYHPPYGKDANFRIYSDIYTAPPGGYADFFINGGTRFEGNGVLSGIVRVNNEVQTDCIVSLYSEDTQEFLQSTTTNASGEFIFEGLNTEELFYIVAKEPSNAWEYRISSRRKPIPVYTPLHTLGSFETNEETNGVDGVVTILGGKLPLSVSVVDPLPYGLTPVLDYRTLTIVGTSDDWGRWRATLRVTASNAVYIDIPVTVDINKGWAPESLGVAPKIWLDHDSSVTDVSGAASVWTNRGSIGGAAGQSSAASRPLILGAELNGKRVLSFDGTNDFMTIPASAQSVLRNVSNATVFAVAKKRTEDTSDTTFPNRTLIQFNRGGGDSHRFGTQLGNNSIPAYNRYSVVTRPLDASSTIEQTPAAAADAIFGAYAMYHAIWDGVASRHSVYVNARLSAEAAPLSTASTTSNTTTTAPVRIGASGVANIGSESAFADMDLACLLVWSEGLLSEADRQRLEGYYADVYALAGNLPVDHPFRHAAPYRATPVLQQSFGADPVVLGFVAATSSGNAGAATGPAVTPLGTWFNGGPNLSAGQGVSIMSDGDDITVTLTGITPPATPAQAVLLDHKGMHIVSIPLTASGGDYSGSVPGTLNDGEAYYLKIEAQ